MAFINAAGQLGPLKVTYNFPMQQIAGTVVSKAGTVTGSDGVGSSLFLQRIVIPMMMSVSEIDIALSIGFPATNQGAGTMSRSFVVYSMGNSTSLASIMSGSGTSAWGTGTSTAGASSSLTQFQGGWSSPLIQPMTFNSSTLAEGEYVVGQLFNFAQGSSTWTINLYGANAISSILASAATNLTSASLSAASTFATASSALTAFTAAPVVANAMLSNAMSAAANHVVSATVSSYASQFIALSLTSPLVAWTISQSMTVASLSTVSSLMSGANWSISSSATAKTDNVAIVGQSSNSNIVSAVGLATVAASLITAATGSSAVLANSSTAGFSAMISHTTASIAAVTNVALGALSSSTLAQAALPNFGFIGTGSTTSNYPYAFVAGVMSTGAVPAAITLTSTAVNYSGSAAFMQPWFQLCGSH